MAGVMTPLERGARALCLMRRQQWGMLAETEKQGLTREAGAVMMALLEPPEDVLAAGVEQLEHDENSGGLLGGSREAVDRMFTAMIKQVANPRR